jgi:ATP-dependent Clp protease ATP-binding subunit ClpA
VGLVRFACHLLVLAVVSFPLFAQHDVAREIGLFYFPDSRVTVRFFKERSEQVRIIAVDANGISRDLFSGPLKKFGVSGAARNATRLFSGEITTHRNANFTFAITGSGELLLISNRGYLIRHPQLPIESDYVKVWPLGDGSEYTAISILSKEMNGTYLYEFDRGILVKISANILNDEQAGEMVLDLDDFMLEMPEGRSVDLLRLEMETTFEPKEFKKVLNAQGGKVNPDHMLPDLSMDLRESADLKKTLPLSSKDKENVQKMVEALKRKDARSLVLLGQSGTGKTTLIESLLDEVPRTWDVLAISRESLEQGATFVGEIEKRVNALIQAARKRPIIYVFDEFHTLKGLGSHSASSVDLMQMLKKHIASGDLMIVATDTPEEYQRAFGSDPALKRRFTEIRVEEPRNEELFFKLTGWIKQKSNLQIDENLLKRVVSVSSDYDPGVHEPARSVRLLEQILTDMQRAQRKDPQAADIDKAAWNLYGVGPQDPRVFIPENEAKRKLLLEQVVDQPDLVNGMVDLWREVNLGVSPKKHRSILAVGPTGAGKTFSGQSFAKVVLNDPERFLEIDMTKYRNGNFDSLIGTAKYHSDSPPGILPEFLSGRGKGRSVIVLNEIEKAHPDLIKVLMEMFDSGKLQGGDGRTYYLGRSIIILTSNRGADEIYPVGQGSALSRAELNKRLASFTDKKIRDLFLKPSSKNLYDTSDVWGAAELQRIDRAVVVLPPSFEGAVGIVKKRAHDMSEEMKEHHFYTLAIDQAIAEEIVRTYYVPEEGVRSLLYQTDNLLNRLHQEAVLELEPKPDQELAAQWKGRTETGEAQILLQNLTTKKDIKVTPPLQRTGELNPLLDASSLSRLQNLETELGKKVFGQDEALKVIARSVRTRSINSKLKIPGHALLLGPTGTGKTETGRSLAEVLYGSSARFKHFSFGQIKNEHDWSNIFGSARGVIGSDTMCPFEKALNEFPEGMVINLDEIGNMGTDPSQPAGLGTPRSEFLKRLYDMFEEGKWTSPLGKTYDLRKHFILMTSNEGQEFFEKLPNDDLRLAEWKRLNQRDVIREILLKHGWPEPLLGRIGSNIALMKPLIHSEQIMIAQKEVERVMNELKAAYQIENIQVADGFYERLTDSFFSHAQGARSLRQVAENAIVDLMGQALIEHSFEREKLPEASFVLDMADNFAGKIRRTSFDTSEREVLLQLTVQFPGREPQVYEADTTREAKTKRLVSFQENMFVSYHEAGHAVANSPELTGEAIDFITTRGDGNFGGYARYKEEQPILTLGREAVVARIARLLAGSVAQQMAGFPKDSGWSSDLEQARQTAEKAITTWGLSDKALRFPVKDGKVVTSSKEVQNEIADLVEEGRQEADRILHERWVEVRMVAIKLMMNGHLDKNGFEQARDTARAAAPKKLERLEEIFQAAKNEENNKPILIPKRWRCLNLVKQISSAKP